jgi:uncharacterized alpha-E superfamily protein
VLSRVANLIYWTARYLERAENAARIVDVNAQLVLDLQSRQSDERRLWEPLVYVSGGDKVYRSVYGDVVTEQSVIEFMLFERENPSSVASCVSAARENARCVRDQLAGEIWEELNSFYLKLKDDGYKRYAEVGSAEYLNWIKSQIHLFYGVADSMIPRTEMWSFFELGRFLERADNTSRILDVKYFMILPELGGVGSALDMVQWASVLRSCSGFEAFRKSRRGQLNLERVVDFLIRDPAFPRSILFSVESARAALSEVTRAYDQQEANAADQLLLQVAEELRGLDGASMIKKGLHEYLDHVQMQIAAIHAAVQETFIAYPTIGAKMLG